MPKGETLGYVCFGPLMQTTSLEDGLVVRVPRDVWMLTGCLLDACCSARLWFAIPISPLLRPDHASRAARSESKQTYIWNACGVRGDKASRQEVRYPVLRP